MASTGISPMHDPVGVIIAILPRCGSPIVNLVYSSLSRISPTVTLLKASYFLLHTLSPIFLCSLLCFKEAGGHCLCVLRLSGRGGSVKLAAALLGFSGLNWDILSEWHTYLHAVCFFSFLFFLYWPLTTLLITSASTTCRNVHTDALRCIFIQNTCIFFTYICIRSSQNGPSCSPHWQKKKHLQRIYWTDILNQHRLNIWRLHAMFIITMSTQLAHIGQDLLSVAN